MAKPNKTCSTSRQLTPRQGIFAANLLQGKTLTEAARRAGYSEKNLAQSGHQVLKAIRLGMPELMDEVGLTERALIEKHLVPLLSAKVPKFFQHKGKVIDSRQVPAHATRLNALDIALRLRGAYERPQVQQEQKTVSVIMLDSSLRPDRTGLVDTRDTLEVAPFAGWSNSRCMGFILAVACLVTDVCRSKARPGWIAIVGQ